jgi:methylmalonyl-CoA mutase
VARAARERALADRQEALIGASEYPGIADVPVLDVPRVALHDSFLTSYGFPAAVTCEPLTPVRLAAPFERSM